MNAIELLKTDHREAMTMINQLQATASEPTPADSGVFGRLRDALLLHTKLEETFFYPELENFDETEELIEESYEEHEEVEALLSEMDPGSSDWEDQITELKENIEHHVEEEENDMFPKAQSLLGTARLEELGREMEEMKSKRPAAA